MLKLSGWPRLTWGRTVRATTLAAGLLPLCAPPRSLARAGDDDDEHVQMAPEGTRVRHGAGSTTVCAHLGTGGAELFFGPLRVCSRWANLCIPSTPMRGSRGSGSDVVRDAQAGVPST